MPGTGGYSFAIKDRIALQRNKTRLRSAGDFYSNRTKVAVSARLSFIIHFCSPTFPRSPFRYRYLFSSPFFPIHWASKLVIPIPWDGSRYVGGSPNDHQWNSPMISPWNVDTCHDESPGHIRCSSPSSHRSPSIFFFFQSKLITNNSSGFKKFNKHTESLKEKIVRNSVLGVSSNCQITKNKIKKKVKDKK